MSEAHTSPSFTGFTFHHKVATAHSKEVTNLSAVGSRVLSCSKDATARLYHVSEDGMGLDPECVFRGHGINVSAGDLGAGEGVATCSADGTGKFCCSACAPSLPVTQHTFSANQVASHR